MKEINIINAVVRECGLTAEDVVKNWYVNGNVHADFLQSLCGATEEKKPFSEVNFIPSKKFVTPKRIKPGMFYYADGLIFPELIKDNQVSAIVGCVEKNHGLALGLRETELPWSSDWLYVDMPSGLSGKEATAQILKTAKEQHEKAEAAEWCAEYTFDGIKAGTGFLPNKEELKRIFGNRKKLRQSFVLLNSEGLSADSLQDEAFYWSSSEYGNDDYAWNVRASDGYVYDDYPGKSLRLPVRCTIEFKI